MKKWFSEWTEMVKAFNPNVKSFMLANFCIQIGMGIFSVMYNLYIKELGLSETVNGSAISLNSLALVIMLIPAGLLSDKFGRKKIIIIGAVLSAVMLFGRSMVAMEQPILWLSFLTGLVWALLQVSGVPFLAENSTPKERMHLFSMHFSFVTVANVIGNLLGGVLADALQVMTTMTEVMSIRISLIVGVCIFIGGIVPLFKLTSKKEDDEVKDASSSTIKEKPTKQSKQFNFKMIILFGIANLLIGSGSGLVIPYLNLYFANRFDASNSFIGLIIALGSAMTAVAMLIGPMLVKRVGKVRALIIFQFASIPFLFLTAYTGSILLASIGFLMRQALMNAGNPITSAIAMDVVDDRYKGFANSVNQMVFNVGWATMGLPATWLVTTYGSYWGYAYTFTITGFLYLIASTYFYFIFGRKFQLKSEQVR